MDINPDHLGRRTPLTYGLCGDVKATVEALMPYLTENHDSGYLQKCVAHYSKVRNELDELATGTSGRKPIHPQYLAKVVSDLASDDAIFTCDVGTPTLWAARYLKMNGRRRLLGSFNHGTMANALPHAIGAQVSSPYRQVVALSGDGGLSMLMGDLLTLRQHRLPVKVVVFNNSALSFVELEMKAAGYLELGTDLVNPNFSDLAKSLGIDGMRVEDPTDLVDTIRQALQHNGPALVDVVVNRQELSLPPKITLQQAHGFTLWMLKAVLNNHGNELIELSKTNLFR